METTLGHNFSCVYSTSAMRDSLIESIEKCVALDRDHTAEDFFEVVGDNIQNIIVQAAVPEGTIDFSKESGRKLSFAIMLMRSEKNEGIQKFLKRLTSDFFEFAEQAEARSQEKE